MLNLLLNEFDYPIAVALEKAYRFLGIDELLRFLAKENVSIVLWDAVIDYDDKVRCCYE